MTDLKNVDEFIKSKSAMSALYGYASSLMRKLNKPERAKEAKDYVFETCEELYLKSQQEDVHDLFQFCKTVMWRKIISENKKQSNNHDDISAAMQVYTEEQPILEKEEIIRIDNCMKKKYPAEFANKIYTLHFHEGLPIREILKQSSGNYNTTRNLLSEMRKDIKDCYNN